MALKPRDHTRERIAQEAAEVAYRITMERLVIDEETGQIRLGGRGRGDLERIQPAHTDYLQPWGMRGLPPSGTEGILLDGSPRAAVVATKSKPPASLRKGASKQVRGDNAIFDDKGNTIRLNQDGGAEIDVSGGTTQKLKVHKGGSVDAVALAANVLKELQDIKDWADGHTHTYLQATGPGVTGTIALATTAPLSVVPAPDSVAATTLEAE